MPPDIWPSRMREGLSFIELLRYSFYMNYTKYLSWTILGGLLASLFIPFIIADGQHFVGMFFPYITGKNFTFRILTEILFGLYILLAIRDPKYRPRSSWLLWAVGAFVLWMGLATALSVDPAKSFWGNFERMDGYITVLHLFMYFIMAGAMLTAEKWWERFFQVSVSASILQGAIAVMQFTHTFGLTPSSQSGGRADGTFGNATYLAVYMLFNLFITLFLIANTLKEKNALRNSRVILAFYGLATVLQFFGLFFTETRGTILGLVGGLIIAALFIVVRGKAEGQGAKILRNASFGLLGLILVLGAAFLALKDTSFIRNTPTLSRIASISLEDKTTMSRFIIWSMALKGVAEKPVFGWGQENFSYVFNKYYDPNMYAQEQWFDRAHNEFIDWLVAGGAPAFLLYFSFFLLASWAIVRSKDLSVPEQAVLLGALAAYTFNNLFVFDNLLSLVYFYIVLAFAHSMSKRALPGTMQLAKPGSDQMVAVAAPIVLVLTFGVVWMLNAPGMTRAQVLISALSSQNQRTGAPLTAEDHFNSFTEALTYGELGRQETVEQLFQFASGSVAPAPSISPATKEKVYNLTRTAGLALLDQRKDDARLELFMGVFYSQFGKYDDALVEFTKSVSHSPKKQQILFQAGVAYLQKGDIENAVALFKKAYELQPDYADARILYASGLFYQKKEAEADKLLTDKFGTALYDDARLLQTYTNLKMFDRVIGIWNTRVAAKPGDANVLLGLAGAYFASGNKAKTIEIIRQVEAMDATSKPQMEAVIKQIQDGTLK